MTKAERARNRINLLAVMRSQEELGTLVSGVGNDGFWHVEFLPLSDDKQVSNNAFLWATYAPNFAITYEALDKALEDMT